MTTVTMGDPQAHPSPLPWTIRDCKLGVDGAWGKAGWVEMVDANGHMFACVQRVDAELILAAVAGGA